MHDSFVLLLAAVITAASNGGASAYPTSLKLFAFSSRGLLSSATLGNKTNVLIRRDYAYETTLHPLPLSLFSFSPFLRLFHSRTLEIRFERSHDRPSMSVPTNIHIYIYMYVCISRRFLKICRSRRSIPSKMVKINRPRRRGEKEREREGETRGNEFPMNGLR